MKLFSNRVGQGLSNGIDNTSKFSSQFETKVELIKYGIEYGLTFIDTAESYGSGMSEEIVGQAVKNFRDQAKVATKFSPENSSYSSVIQSADKSLERLGVESIDLYQIHWPNPKIEIAETMSALLDLKSMGKIQNIGVCNFSVTQLKSAIHEVGENVIVSNQVEYNIFDRYIEDEILPFCETKGIRVIAYSPLDRGRLPHDANQNFRLREISEFYGMTTHQLILNWLVSNPTVVAIPASSSKVNLKANAESTQIQVNKNHLEEISQFRIEVSMIRPSEINVSEFGEDNRKVYKSLSEAKQNKLNFCPSPEELSEEIKLNSNIKPVRLIPSIKPDFDFRFDLVEGRIRYWAWVMAFGFDKPIPAYIRVI